MTREEELRKHTTERFKNQDEIIKSLISEAAVLGMMWADEHPKNPWRDAKTDPPKEGQEVFAHVPNLCGGEYCKLTYLGNYRWSQDDGEWTTEFNNNEVLWMPIPKGGEK